MKIQQLQSHMRKASLDYCLLFNLDSDHNFFYFAQSKVNGALLVSQRDSRLIVSKLDFSYNRSCRSKTVLWSKGRLLDSAKQLMKNARRVGVDKDNMTLRNFMTMKKGFKGAELVNISDKCSELRATKTSAELNKIRQACRTTEKILQECQLGFANFRKETDVSNFLKIKTLEHNCELAFEPVVASGSFASVPHHVPRDTRLRKGFCVVDFGVRYQGYCADLTRTFFIGRPNKREIDLFDRASHAQQQLILAIKPGVQVDSLYANAKKLLGKYLIHAAGHGIGIEVHEMPVLGPENKQRISQGMVISIEPAIYVPRAYGIRVEDMVHVTRNGCKLLSQPQELITV